MKTNCKDKDGVIVGLIDSLIFVSRVLAEKLRERNSNGDNVYSNPAIIEALKDFSTDKDVHYIAGFYEGSPIAPITQDNIESRKIVRKIIKDFKESGNKIVI